MKSLFVVIVVAAVAVAEPPLSKSYLPPSPTSRGYPQGPQSGPAFAGAPQVIAARTLEQTQTRSNSFARNSAQGKFGAAATQGYDENAASFARNSIEAANSEPANYNFGYMVNDYNEGTDFGHREQRVEERAQGEYHVVLPDGRKQTVSYEADERGFKPQISYQDTEDLTRSNGYDSNTNNARNANDFQNGGRGDHDDRSGY